MRSPLEYLQIASEVKAVLPSKKFETLSIQDKLKVALDVYGILQKHNVTMDEIGTLLHSTISVGSLLHL